LRRYILIHREALEWVLRFDPGLHGARFLPSEGDRSLSDLDDGKLWVHETGNIDTGAVDSEFDSGMKPPPIADDIM
jgi:hypothetical protein